MRFSLYLVRLETLLRQPRKRGSWGHIRMTSVTDQLLQAVLSVVGRSAFPIATVRRIVGRGGPKHFQAYNLCDGTRSLTAIAKQLRLDPGNFSRTISRWTEAGIVFRLGSGREGTLLHVYPLGESVKKGEEE